MPKKKIEFKTPRVCTKTHDFGCTGYDRCWTLTEEWEVALDDLCDLLIKTTKARKFLAAWSEANSRDESDAEPICKVIAAQRIEIALERLRQAQLHLEAAWAMEQDYAYDVYHAQKKDAPARS